MARKCIEGYNFIELLGSGGFGEVWLVEKEGKFFAIKICEENDTVWEEITFLEQLKHPNLLRMIEYFEKGGKLYIVTKLYGENICSINFSDVLLRRLYRNMKNVLNYLHSNSILHNDIHPKNILTKRISEKVQKIIEDYCLEKELPIPRFMNYDEFVLIDLNMAGYEGNDFLTSLEYNSPEMVFGWEVYKESDYWMLGATMYEVIMKKPLIPYVEDEQEYIQTFKETIGDLEYFDEEKTDCERTCIFKGMKKSHRKLIENLLHTCPDDRSL